ncbi:MAG: terpene cyclase/mutase family protein [Anaerolineales bacterium]|nr:terpene cyclase/mutase family protein [Anaerolineales bacterium]
MKKNINASYLVYDFNSRSILLAKNKNKYGFFKKDFPPNSLSSVDFSMLCEIIKSEINVSVQLIRILRIDTLKKENLLLLFALKDSFIDQKSNFSSQWINPNDYVETEKDVNDVIKYIQQDSLEWQLPQDLGKKVKNVNDRAISFLESNVVQGDLVGWPHYLGEGKIGSIGTAAGILCHVYTNRFSGIIDSCINTLKKIQNVDGGWSILSADKTDISITESTLFTLLALKHAGISNQDKTILKGIKWLEKTQKESGGWGTSIFSTNEGVFQTAFAVRVLSNFDTESRMIQKGMMWIKKAVNLDGGWSAYSTNSKTKSNALYTAHSLIALMAGGENTDSELIKGGCKQIIKERTQAIEYGWEDLSYIEPASNDISAKKVHYNHFSLPWILLSLVRTGIPIYDPEIMVYYNTLIRNQHALGYWEHKLTPEKMPIWAMHDSLLMLNKIGDYSLNHFDHLLSISSIKQENFILRKSIVDILSNNSNNAIDNAKWVAIGSGFLLSGFILWGFLTLGFSPITSVIGTALITGLVPFLYQIALEEYKKMRNRKENNE